MKINLVDPTIPRCYLINEKQMVGFLTKNQEAATSLTTRDKIKEFFTNLFCCFSGIAPYDKKAFLNTLYQDLYGNSDVPSPVNIQSESGVDNVCSEMSVHQFWMLFLKFLSLAPYSEQSKFSFKLNTEPHPGELCGTCVKLTIDVGSDINHRVNLEFPAEPRNKVDLKHIEHLFLKIMPENKLVFNERKLERDSCQIVFLSHTLEIFNLNNNMAFSSLKQTIKPYN